MPTSEHPRPYRKGSVFGDGRRSRLDGNARARFRFLLRAHARTRRLPPKQEWVGQALLKHLAEGGRCDPSYETLAADVGCSARTAQRATATLRALGLLTWQTRLVRSTATGWQAHQTSNAYELRSDVPNPAIVHGRQNGGPIRRESLIPVPAAILDRTEKEAADREAGQGLLPIPLAPAWNPPPSRNPAQDAAMLAKIRAERQATLAKHG